MKRNKLNDLASKEWLKFQKSWFVHNPPPRKKGHLDHPAKYPETLAQEFVEFFTKRGQWVLDPMVGTGSTLVACIRAGRNGLGIEINEGFCRVAAETAAEEKNRRGTAAEELSVDVLHADARNLPDLDTPVFDYCLTSPPYWDMLRMKGAQTQKAREEAGLKLAYSEDPEDLGNISDYDEFIEALVDIYLKVYRVLEDRAYMTIIVKNVKKKGKLYPLAWDLAAELGKTFALKDEKIWCQDNQTLRPYGLGSAWVSNTFHHYCLNFRKE